MHRTSVLREWGTDGNGLRHVFVVAQCLCGWSVECPTVTDAAWCAHDHMTEVTL